MDFYAEVVQLQREEYEEVNKDDELMCRRCDPGPIPRLPRAFNKIQPTVFATVSKQPGRKHLQKSEAVCHTKRPNTEKQVQQSYPRISIGDELNREESVPKGIPTPHKDVKIAECKLGVSGEQTVAKQHKPGASIFTGARYFLMKSINYENIAISQQQNVWSTRPYNQAILDNAFKRFDNVILIFSVQRSGKFQGFARILTLSTLACPPIRWILPETFRSKDFRMVFLLEWIDKCEIVCSTSDHLTNSLNDNKPVKFGRDGQEIEPCCGESLCKLFPSFTKAPVFSSENRLPPLRMNTITPRRPSKDCNIEKQYKQKSMDTCSSENHKGGKIEGKTWNFHPDEKPLKNHKTEHLAGDRVSVSGLFSKSRGKYLTTVHFKGNTRGHFAAERKRKGKTDRRYQNANSNIYHREGIVYESAKKVLRRTYSGNSHCRKSSLEEKPKKGEDKKDNKTIFPIGKTEGKRLKTDKPSELFRNNCTHGNRDKNISSTDHFDHSGLNRIEEEAKRTRSSKNDSGKQNIVICPDKNEQKLDGKYPSNDVRPALHQKLREDRPDEGCPGRQNAVNSHAQEVKRKESKRSCSGDEKKDRRLMTKTVAKKRLERDSGQNRFVRKILTTQLLHVGAATKRCKLRTQHETEYTRKGKPAQTCKVLMSRTVYPTQKLRRDQPTEKAVKEHNEQHSQKDRVISKVKAEESQHDHIDNQVNGYSDGGTVKNKCHLRQSKDGALLGTKKQELFVTDTTETKAKSRVEESSGDQNKDDNGSRESTSLNDLKDGDPEKHAVAVCDCSREGCLTEKPYRKNSDKLIEASKRLHKRMGQQRNLPARDNELVSASQAWYKSLSKYSNYFPAGQGAPVFEEVPSYREKPQKKSPKAQTKEKPVPKWVLYGFRKQTC